MPTKQLVQRAPNAFHSSDTRQVAVMVLQWDINAACRAHHCPRKSGIAGHGCKQNLSSSALLVAPPQKKPQHHRLSFCGGPSRPDSCLMHAPGSHMWLDAKRSSDGSSSTCRSERKRTCHRDPSIRATRSVLWYQHVTRIFPKRTWAIPQSARKCRRMLGTRQTSVSELKWPSRFHEPMPKNESTWRLQRLSTTHILLPKRVIRCAAARRKVRRGADVVKMQNRRLNFSGAQQTSLAARRALVSVECKGDFCPAQDNIESVTRVSVSEETRHICRNVRLIHTRVVMHGRR